MKRKFAVMLCCTALAAGMAACALLIKTVFFRQDEALAGKAASCFSEDKTVKTGNAGHAAADDRSGAVLFRPGESQLFFPDRELTEDYSYCGGRAVKAGDIVYAVTENYPGEELFRLRSEDTGTHRQELLLTAEEIDSCDARELVYYRDDLYFSVKSTDFKTTRIVRFSLADRKAEILYEAPKAQVGRIVYGRWMVLTEDGYRFFDLESGLCAGTVSFSGEYLGAMQGKLFFNGKKNRVLSLDEHGTLTDLGSMGPDVSTAVPVNGCLYMLEIQDRDDEKPSAKITVCDAQTFNKTEEIPVPAVRVNGWMEAAGDSLFLQEAKEATDHWGPIWRLDLKTGSFSCLNENRFYVTGATLIDGHPAEYISSLEIDDYYDMSDDRQDEAE